MCLNLENKVSLASIRYGNFFNRIFKGSSDTVTFMLFGSEIIKHKSSCLAKADGVP